MDEDKEIQILAKKTPVFTVLKNGSFLKNIFLLHKPSRFSTSQSAADTSSINQEPNEEVLLVGRHPDCNITLEHPSISRHHLRIHSNPSSHMLSVVDLSSVHGTRVSGKRIEPLIPVKLKEGDTVRIGGSSRVYELHWVPLNQAFDLDNPFVPATFRKQEETQEESCSYVETQFSDEDLESYDLSFSNENLHSSMEKSNPLTCSPPDYLNSSCGDTELEEHISPSKIDTQNGEYFSTNLVQSPVVVPVTEISDSLSIIEDQSNSLRDNIGNESDPFSVPNCSECSTDGEIFSTVSIQTPPVVTESTSETYNFSDGLNESEEDLYVEHLNAIETQEEDALNQDIARGLEIDQKINKVGSEFEQIDQTDSMGVKSESVMKREPVFFNETDMLQEQTFTPRGKEVSRTVFDSLDGKELEFFTPDKENKDPNACVMKSLSKRWKEDEYKRSNIFTLLKEAVSPTVSEVRKDFFDLSDYDDEVLFSSEKEAMKMEESINYPQKIIDSSNKEGAKKRWTMVLDTNTLLHNESMKHLKLLQGLKGTQLFIPKTVLNELMDMKSQDHFFNIATKKVSLALKWIDECMITTKWWIHIHIDDAESKVLETAIQLCKEIKDEKIMILSDDLSLKIKAMAQGIMCEEAEEFFRSLVNPFSERFMWVGSLARGLTWSCLEDDDVLREKYLKVSNRFKGLKPLARITTL